MAYKIPSKEDTYAHDEEGLDYGGPPRNGKSKEQKLDQP
jgi:hypothetical protein